MRSQKEVEEYVKLIKALNGPLKRHLKDHLFDPNMVDDCAQEVYILGFKKMDAVFDSENPTGWIFNTATHFCSKYNEIKMKDDKHVEKREGKRKMSAAYEIAMVEVESTIKTAVSDAEWDLVNMRVDGYTFNEISEKTGEKSVTLRKRLSRLKEKLKKLIKSELDEYARLFTLK
jgi:DNA-directed RNA polymerase specialized sigma24 family protein